MLEQAGWWAYAVSSAGLEQADASMGQGHVIDLFLLFNWHRNSAWGGGFCCRCCVDAGACDSTWLAQMAWASCWGLGLDCAVSVVYFYRHSLFGSHLNISTKPQRTDSQL